MLAASQKPDFKKYFSWHKFYLGRGETLSANDLLEDQMMRHNSTTLRIWKRPPPFSSITVMIFTEQEKRLHGKCSSS
ncbi:uncharacterized protein PHALS_15025 [Plasmopara halstedii]|uniref:Uncharacterized protein n=1 Tax=Plasmopara halstedii TaxID=4781 RepID=A0A0P1A7H5_PLAHL|nr:uncharacterized protein PHALS_15025 [Plasmopara halstedii]CEG36168.1 hypothetical protein PHALS_15025 [Plasmopara halstedii]|eukprot:XP_024572537.1 hypothetical protein PHALS_15025 [Plasmopara halstedii]